MILKCALLFFDGFYQGLSNAVVLFVLTPLILLEMCLRVCWQTLYVLLAGEI